MGREETVMINSNQRLMGCKGLAGFGVPTVIALSVGIRAYLP